MSVGLGIAIVIVFLLLVVFWREGSKPQVSKVRAPADLSAEPTRAPVSGMEELGQYLERSGVEEAEAKRAEEERRDRLIALWREVEPKVLEAVKNVNYILSAHRGEMHLELSEAEFVGRDEDAFGIICKLVGSGRPSLGYDGEFGLVLYNEKLYVGGFHSWGEGAQLPVEGVTVDVLANAIANGARWALEG
jgi:hypothetical protein